jgi:hypothetical protein
MDHEIFIRQEINTKPVEGISVSSPLADITVAYISMLFILL